MLRPRENHHGRTKSYMRLAANVRFFATKYRYTRQEGCGGGRKQPPPCVAHTPGVMKSVVGPVAQLGGIAAMRTKTPTAGMPPSTRKNWYQPGGHTLALGGAVIVQVPPPQATSGISVRAPMELPWVLETAPRRVTDSWPLPAVV